jgi:hypothetical protein
VPKIDWFDNTDDQPRWEPRARRERLPRDLRERRARLDQIIAMASSPPLVPDVATRRPLHLIWGVPMRRPADSDTDGSAKA